MLKKLSRTDMNILTTIKNFFLAFFGKRSIKPDSCKTKDPILLVHGIGFRDDMLIPSWGEVPAYLEKGGATVYLADTEAWASYTVNGEIIRDKISQILNETNAEKVNIIAHSKGGIDARYAISFYQLDDQVASLTTIGSPHKGTCIADIVTENLPEQAEFLYDAVNCLGKLLGDKSPESSKAGPELTRKHMSEFNEKHPNASKVFYQSYGSEMTNAMTDPMFSATYLILNKFEGENDGMISKNSYQWGEFQGVIKPDIPGLGISHAQITGAVLEIISGKNIPLLYVEWVSKLKDKGF